MKAMVQHNPCVILLDGAGDQGSGFVNVFIFYVFLNEMQLKEKRASFRFMKEMGFKPDIKVIVPW